MSILTLMLVMLLVSVQAEAGLKKAYVQASKANIRKAPEAKGKLLGKLSIGTKVDVLEKTADGWAKIRHEDLTGWTLASLLTDTEPTLQGMIDQYNALDATMIAERRNWAERAAALAPRDPRAVQLLIEALQAAGATKELRHAQEGLKALAPIYFSNGTFSDDPSGNTLQIVPSPLSCHKQVVRKFTRGAKHPAKIPWERQVSPEKVWPILHRHCSEFHPDRTIWSLVPNEAAKTARWEKIAIDPIVNVRTYFEEPCESELIKPPRGELTLGFKRKSAGAVPALFLSSFHAPSTSDVAFVALEKLERTEPTKTTFRTSLRGAEKSENIREIFIESHHEKFHGEGTRLEKAIMKEKLIVVWNSGKRSEIFESKGYGYYSFTPAGISKVTLTDADNDGGLDFIVHGLRDEHEVVLTQNQEIKGRHKLEAAELVPVGGC